MDRYQCNIRAWREVHIHLDAESDEDAAQKAIKIAEDKVDLILTEGDESLYVGPEEVEFDEEIEVVKALPGPVSFWDDPRYIYV